MPKGRKWPNGRPDLWKDNPHPMLGKRHSEETKRKISEAQKARHARSPIGFLSGENHPFWNGGKVIKKPYVLVYSAHRKNNVLEHRLVMAKYIGRDLLPTEDVHHKDGNPRNNSIENLEVIDRHTHRSTHMRDRWEHWKGVY